MVLKSLLNLHRQQILNFMIFILIMHIFFILLNLYVGYLYAGFTFA